MRTKIRRMLSDVGFSKDMILSRSNKNSDPKSSNPQTLKPQTLSTLSTAPKP